VVAGDHVINLVYNIVFKDNADSSITSGMTVKLKTMPNCL